MSLKFLGLAIVILLAALPAQANETIKNCLSKNPQVKSKILSAFKDKAALNDPNPKRPTEYYQIGEETTWRVQSKEWQGYNAFLIVIDKAGQCHSIDIEGLYGYEIYVPYPAAVIMEGKAIDWTSKNIVEDAPPEETKEVDPAEFGHGCEDWTQAMAEARKSKGLGLDGCSVRQQRLKPFWQTQ